MKPRYFKHYWGNSRKKLTWYRINEDGTVEKRQVDSRTNKAYAWYKAHDGALAMLHEANVKEISEEDYFLDQL